MMDLHINKGFESMIPKKKEEEKKPVFSHQISFKVFNKEFKFFLEVKGDDS
jgi:hypothetical protein